MMYHHLDENQGEDNLVVPHPSQDKDQDPAVPHHRRVKEEDRSTKRGQHRCATGSFKS